MQKDNRYTLTEIWEMFYKKENGHCLLCMFNYPFHGVIQYLNGEAVYCLCPTGQYKRENNIDKTLYP